MMQKKLRLAFKGLNAIPGGAISRLKSSTLAKNSLWVFAGSGLSIAIGALNLMVIARLLAPSEIGLYVGAASFVALVAGYSNLGTGSVFLRYVSQDRSQFAVFFGNILLTIGVMGSILAIGIHISSRWLLGSTSVALVTIVGIGDVFFLNITGVMSQVFQTYEQMRISAFLGLFGNASRLVLACCLLLAFHHVTALSWAYAVVFVSFICAVISVTIAMRKFGLPRFKPSLGIKHAGEGLSFAMSGTAVGAYNDIDKVMMVHYGMDAATGIYAMAYRTVDVCTAPIRSIHAAAFPRFFRLGAKGVQPAQEFASRLLRRTSVIGLLGTAGLLIGAPLIPHLIGARYHATVEAMRWLCLLPFIRSIHLSAGDALAGIGYQRLRLGAQFAAALFNFGVNLFLIPRYSWRGAAWSSIATDGALAILCWSALLFLLRKEIRANEFKEMALANESAH
jgi:O-antigen/teichoic acid export membrane protein